MLQTIGEQNIAINSTMVQILNALSQNQAPMAYPSHHYSYYSPQQQQDDDNREAPPSFTTM